MVLSVILFYVIDFIQEKYARIHTQIQDLLFSWISLHFSILRLSHFFLNFRLLKNFRMMIVWHRGTELSMQLK